MTELTEEDLISMKLMMNISKKEAEILINMSLASLRMRKLLEEVLEQDNYYGTGDLEKRIRKELGR